MPCAACLFACLPVCLLACVPVCLLACVRGWTRHSWDGHLTRQRVRGSINQEADYCWLAGHLEDCDMRRTPTRTCNYRPVPLGLLARAAGEQEADLA